MTFGERLQKLRNENRLSQDKIAELVGVSRQAVSKWENDLSYPDTKNLIILAEIFNLSMDELLSLSSSNPQLLQNETIASNEKVIKSKIYYHNEIRTKLISYIILIIFVPLNIIFYNKGIYGEVYLELGFLGKEFLKQSVYDIPFIIVMVGLLIKATKDIRNINKSDDAIDMINNKDKIIGYVCFGVISLILIVVYFKAPEFSSIALFLGMFGLVYISIFELIRDLTKKVLM